jgi:acyl-CoA synthetase (AMP-forming)/AMP-acid ligase II
MTDARMRRLHAHRAFEREPYPDSMGALLDQAAARFGDHPAFVFFQTGERLTFHELKERADRLAAALARLGVVKGTHVALMVPNGPAFPVTWLALARLGAVMIPVNNRYTARELAYVLKDADADFLVIHSDYLPVLEGVDQAAPAITEDRVIVVGERRAGPGHHWDELIDGAPAAFVARERPSLDDLLNIQYTSGTTGFPKGCMQTHRYWLLMGATSLYTAGFSVKRILVNQHFYYLDPLLFITMGLFVGATLYVCGRPSASHFMEWVREFAIDFCFLFEPIFKQPPHPLDSQNSLELACIFGFTRESHAELERRFDTTAREWFGMTEIGAGLYVPVEDSHMVGSGSCGIPTPFREVMIVGPDGRPVARGEIGELCVRGPGTMLGYYRKPEANAASFLGDWFRTGDLFREDEQGYFYIVGRIKEMIRRSQENISAREVEEVLRAMPEIKDVAAVPVPDPLRGEEVKAYVQLLPGLRPTDVPPERIFAHCKRQLASFKIPRYLEYRDVFSYGPADRVEKQQLIAEKADLRQGSYDRVSGTWR